jgi:hypothetical protein
MNEPSQRLFIVLNALDPVPVVGLEGQPGFVNACPFPKIQNPIIFLGFLPTGESRLEGFGANPIFALKGQQFFFQRVNVGKDL